MLWQYLNTLKSSESSVCEVRYAAVSGPLLRRTNPATVCPKESFKFLEEGSICVYLREAAALV